jgi:hypothetical protein
MFNHFSVLHKIIHVNFRPPPLQSLQQIETYINFRPPPLIAESATDRSMYQRCNHECKYYYCLPKKITNISIIISLIFFLSINSSHAKRTLTFQNDKEQIEEDSTVPFVSNEKRKKKVLRTLHTFFFSNHNSLYYAFHSLPDEPS